MTSKQRVTVELMKTKRPQMQWLGSLDGISYLSSTVDACQQVKAIFNIRYLKHE